MINVDYMMKGLWHGAFFPRDERLKFADRWRGNMDVNAHGLPETKKPLLEEFLSAGCYIALCFFNTIGCPKTN